MSYLRDRSSFFRPGSPGLAPFHPLPPPMTHSSCLPSACPQHSHPAHSRCSFKIIFKYSSSNTFLDSFPSLFLSPLLPSLILCLLLLYLLTFWSFCFYSCCAFCCTCPDLFSCLFSDQCFSRSFLISRVNAIAFSECLQFMLSVFFISMLVIACGM